MDDKHRLELMLYSRFNKRGIRFMHAYSPAMTCAPSRAAYMTGQFTPHNGVYHVNMGCRIPQARKEDRPQLDPYYVGRIMPGKPVILPVNLLIWQMLTHPFKSKIEPK